jgi:beta-glucosidase
MTLAEKIGQMTQAERLSLRPGDIQQLGLGSILSAGGSAPGNGTAKEWADMLDEMHAEARNSRLHIPLVYGADAVHGHNNVIGATIFPHNIGLGCARSAELVEAVARATAVEIAATGVDWTFAPVVGPGRDERWGRTYETFSEDPKLSAELGVAAIRGYQSARLGAVPTSVLACAKHFAGDGATLFSAESHKIDQGDTRLSPSEFERLALAPYVPAIAAGVGTVMASFSSVDGVKMHGHQKLLTDVLKGRLGFKGFVISDFSGIHQLDGNFDEQVVSSVNAGIDMFMEPDQFERFIESLTQSVESGKVSMSRIDDAVERILLVKCEAGLFEKPPVDRSLLAKVGSKEHLELARRAVRESAVLLKNEKNILPLSKSARIVVSGSGARSMARQAGGWTIGWQGAENKPVLGTTLFDALRAGASDPARVILDESAISNAAADVAVLVTSEAPYAEGMGDSADLALPASDLKQLDALRARKLPVVVVLFSGRPLVLGAALDRASAVLAAFLPGSAGEGIADILYGDYAPTGKLSHSWPRRLEDVPINQGASPYDPLFPLGFGLSYAKTDAKK